jgi:hypothetical protein
MPARCMSDLKTLIAVRELVRQQHIELLRERIEIYMRNRVDFTDGIDRLQAMLRRLEDARPMFEDSR